MAAAVLLALTTGIFIGRGMDTGPAGHNVANVHAGICADWNRSGNRAGVPGGLP